MLVQLNWHNDICSILALGREMTTRSTKRALATGIRAHMCDAICMVILYCLSVFKTV